MEWAASVQQFRVGVRQENLPTAGWVVDLKVQRMPFLLMFFELSPE